MCARPEESSKMKGLALGVLTCTNTRFYVRYTSKSTVRHGARHSMKILALA